MRNNNNNHNNRELCDAGMSYFVQSSDIGI